MNTNVNLEAAVGALAFLGTALCLGVAGLVVLHALARRKLGRARGVLLAALAVAGLYLGLMLAFSLASTERALARGEEKHFCEIDCHLAYSIDDVRTVKTIGRPPDVATAAGVFYVVTIRTRFDETTISPRRGDAPLTPNRRAAAVLDRGGRKFHPSAAGHRALELSEGAGTPFPTPLRPRESYTTKLVFDLPVDVAAPRLLLHEGDPLTRFIIGHENSPLHKKTTFRLDARRVGDDFLSARGA